MFTNDCPHCGGWHTNKRCPEVRAIEYHPDGSIKRVEYVGEVELQPVVPKEDQVFNPWEYLFPAGNIINRV